MATPTTGGGGKGGAQTPAPVKAGGGAVKTSGKKAPQLPSGVATAGSVPAHMARRVEKGSIGTKGKWTGWPGVE